MIDTLKTWHSLVAAKDLNALWELIAEDAVFHSPLVFKPQEGKPITYKYLAAAMKVIGNEKFRYTGQWTAPKSAVLEFNTEIDGISVDGADFITWNDAGLITEFKVMVRPLKAINIVLQRMGEELAQS